MNKVNYTQIKFILHSNSHTEINWSFFEAVKFIESPVNGQVTNKVKDVVIFLRVFLVKLKHLLSAANEICCF